MTAAPTSPTSNGDGRIQVTRTFSDLLGRPQHGWAKVRSTTWGSADVMITDGTFSAALLPGSYEVTAALYDPDNKLERKRFLLIVEK